MNVLDKYVRYTFLKHPLMIRLFSSAGKIDIFLLKLSPVGMATSILLFLGFRKDFS